MTLNNQEYPTGVPAPPRKSRDTWRGRQHRATTDEYDRLAREALELLRLPLRTFVESRMRREYGDRWADYALGALHTSPALARTCRADLDTDLSALLNTISRFWHVAFGRGSGRFTRTYIEEVREFRNLLAHGGRLTLPDAFRITDTVHRLLGAIGHADRSDSGGCAPAF